MSARGRRAYHYADGSAIYPVERPTTWGARWEIVGPYDGPYGSASYRVTTDGPLSHARELRRELAGAR